MTDDQTRAVTDRAAQSGAISHQADGQSQQRNDDYDLVAAWHASEGHPGAFRHCQQQPCHLINFARRP